MFSVKNGKYSKSQRCQLAVCKDINHWGKDFRFPYIDTITDGGSTATHSKAISGFDGWITLGKRC